MAASFPNRRLTVTIASVLGLLVAALAVIVRAQGFVATFEGDPLGAPPRGFVFSGVKQASAGVWEVRSAHPQQVLVHVADSSLPGRSLAIASAAAPRQLRLMTRVRFSGGTREGGLEWYRRDDHHGYVAGISLARREALLFRVTAGSRVQLARLGDLNLDPDAWHTLSVVHNGDEIRIQLDGIAVLHARDTAGTDGGGGGAGVWSAGSSETWFDDLRIDTLPESPR